MTEKAIREKIEEGVPESEVILDLLKVAEYNYVDKLLAELPNYFNSKEADELRRRRAKYLTAIKEKIEQKKGDPRASYKQLKITTDTKEWERIAIGLLGQTTNWDRIPKSTKVLEELDTWKIDTIKSLTRPFDLSSIDFNEIYRYISLTYGENNVEKIGEEIAFMAKDKKRKSRQIS